MKRICAALLSFFLLASVVPPQIGSVRATELKLVETEPVETTEIQPTEVITQETQPAETSEPTSFPTEPEILTTEPEIHTTEPCVVEPTEITDETVEGKIDFQIDKLEILPTNEIMTAAPVEMIADAGALEDDIHTVSGQGISFRLFNYSTDINKTSSGTAWRPISSYFTFRNSRLEIGTDAAEVNIPSPNTNPEHDQDGFTKYHATVERVLDNGYPVLDLSRNADGSQRVDPGLEKATRSLKYLFASGDHAVTAYSPKNSILQRSGSHYWYNSANNAVDYDASSNMFRLRSFAERNSVTAGYGENYADFLPFTPTGGIVQGTAEDGTEYHVDTDNTDYWFGMTMQVDFFQSKNGKLGDQNMIFSFSGDDDVWVFVDDVLVLDLGGTHGTVNGSINFATGEILQYLSWGGKNATKAEQAEGTDTAFPTSLRACFDAAGRTPNGGWSTCGQTFADYSAHTLKFFYLERGASVANCSLDFRLSTLPDESLTVTKELATENTLVQAGMDYRFRIMKADENGNRTDEPYIMQGMTYDLLENGSKIGTGTVGEDNTFCLKAGQSAQFAQMLEKGGGATRYVVEELILQEQTEQYQRIVYLSGDLEGEIEPEYRQESVFDVFGTQAFSADQTHTVIFRNVVDTRKLGTLKITKLSAAGTEIPNDLYFLMQVKLNGSLLPAGTPYTVGNEIREVETAGTVKLRVGETAVIERAILGGTEYQITELSASLDGFRPSYSGAVEPVADISCTADGVTGHFPLSGLVHVTVVNADYDFAVQIPIHKKVLGFQETGEFFFTVEEVEKTGTGWEVIRTLPKKSISVSGSQTEETIITIGYQSSEEGIYYYRIKEEQGAENYLYDSAAFHVEVTVHEGNAEITDIQKERESADSVTFINRAVTSLTVTKTLAGGTSTMKFPFTAKIFLNGEIFSLPEAAEGSGYAVEGNTISFELGHNESIVLPCIPIDAVVIVEEENHEGFTVLHQLEGEEVISGAVKEVHFSNTPQTIHFINQTGFRLPNTGGNGIKAYTFGGTMLIMSAALLYMLRKRKIRSMHKNG